MAAEEVQAWLSSFEAALLRRDVEAAADMFAAEECFWRDLVAFTWNIYTAESQQEIRDMLHATIDGTIMLRRHEEEGDAPSSSAGGDGNSSSSSSSSWKQEGEVEEQEVGEGMVIKQSFFTFETRVARGRGHVKLRGGDGKCWCLLTAMQELKGHEELAGERRELSAPYPYWAQQQELSNANNCNKNTEEEQRQQQQQPQPAALYCLVVGGGHAGISLGARLRRLRVPTLIIDKNARPGDSWRNCYDSLRLHSPVWYNHLPYLPFPDHWPVFCSKDQIADWLEAYTRIMELLYWGSAECKSARFDEAAGRWEVVVDRGAGGGTVLLRPAHLVLATGLCGLPNVPADVPGAADKFRGVRCHSSEFKGGSAWAGKRCVVVGSSTSAHDICAHLREMGAARVTMLQRSSTHVLRTPTLLALSSLPFSERTASSTHDTDLLIASVPYAILHRPAIDLNKRIAELDAPFYHALQAVGFLHDFGDDGSGALMKYLRRGSGYYIDKGASDLLINGDVALKSNVTVTEMRERSVVLSDGSEVDADLVVYATGYRPMNECVAQLISHDVAHKVGKCWGLGSNTTNDPGPWERELRNMWKPTPQPHLWFHGSTFSDCRHYSLYLALQIKARMEGVPGIRVYGMANPHHTM